MGFGGGYTPPAPAVIPPPPAAHPPVLGSSSSASATNTARSRASKAAGMGFDNTIQTSPEGDLSQTNKAYATLLGQ